MAMIFVMAISEFFHRLPEHLLHCLDLRYILHTDKAAGIGDLGDLVDIRGHTGHLVQQLRQLIGRTGTQFDACDKRTDDRLYWPSCNHSLFFQMLMLLLVQSNRNLDRTFSQCFLLLSTWGS